HSNQTWEFQDPPALRLRQIRKQMKDSFILWIAQGFGVGRIPFAPGTFGSLVGLLWFALLLATKRYELYVIGDLAGAGLSCGLTGSAEKILQEKDPSSVVIDEIVAIPFCFLPWVTYAWLGQRSLPALNTFFTGKALLATAGLF